METLLKDDVKDKSNRKKSCNVKLRVLLALLIIIFGICVILVYVSVGDKKTTSYSIDADFLYGLILSEEIDHTHLRTGVLLKLLTLNEPQGGLYRTSFDRYYNKTGINIVTDLTSQSRVINTYSNAYKHTLYQPFYDAMVHGLNALLTDYYDPIYGGYYKELTKLPNGTIFVSNETKESYALSFALKALSDAYIVSLNQTYLDKANELFLFMIHNMTDYTNVGLTNLTSRDLDVLSTGKTTNVMIHYFHGLTLLYNAQNAAVLMNISTILTLEEIKNRTEMVFNFVMNLREYTNITLFNTTTEFLIIPNDYDDNWVPFKPISENSIIARGFEWTVWGWQAMKWNILNMSDDNIWIMHNIFNYSLYISYNTKTGALYRNLPERFHNITRRWVAVEALRSICYYYFELKLDKYGYASYDLLNVINNAIHYYRAAHFDEKYGGLYEAPNDNRYSKDGRGWHVGLSTLDILKWIKYDLQVPNNGN